MSLFKEMYVLLIPCGDVQHPKSESHATRRKYYISQYIFLQTKLVNEFVCSVSLPHNLTSVECE